ncbi:hypothetical protein, partial [Bacillus cereus group sp. BfR-BA-01321]|uniref:hypothetical protein n=1 Tax=Bacillus cereus group sp. BfR-BA-01321 TaxID=2920297 RepID=UPI001F56EF07
LLDSSRANQTDHKEQVYIEKLVSSKHEKILETYVQSDEIAEQIEYEEETAVEKLLGMNLEETLEMHVQSMDRL